jgi:hypothetical protein
MYISRTGPRALVLMLVAALLLMGLPASASETGRVIVDRNEVSELFQGSKAQFDRFGVTMPGMGMFHTGSLVDISEEASGLMQASLPLSEKMNRIVASTAEQGMILDMDQRPGVQMTLHLVPSPTGNGLSQPNWLRIQADDPSSNPLKVTVWQDGRRMELEAIGPVMESSEEANSTTLGSCELLGNTACAGIVAIAGTAAAASCGPLLVPPITLAGAACLLAVGLISAGVFLGCQLAIAVGCPTVENYDKILGEVGDKVPSDTCDIECIDPTPTAVPAPPLVYCALGRCT